MIPTSPASPFFGIFPVQIGSEMSEAAISKTKNALDACGIEFTCATHPAVMTIEELKVHYQPAWGALAKNLFIKDKRNVNYLLVIAADRKLNMKLVGKQMVCDGDFYVTLILFSILFVHYKHVCVYV